MPPVKIAESDTDIARCFPVVHQLRPHLVDTAFVSRVRLQEREGYRIAYVEDGGEVVSVAGFRIMENLVSGRLLYVDDLVSLEGERSKGYGKALFAWLTGHARTKGCTHLELDSGVQRYDAHRFYLGNRMIISAHHFRMKL